MNGPKSPQDVPDQDGIARCLQDLEIQNPVRDVAREAAVVLPLLPGNEPSFIGIVRQNHGTHGGQFALPGGMPEASDESAWHTAVREMREEVGLAGEISNLGFLERYDTHVSQTRVSVFVGALTERQDWVPEPEEVQGIFEIPIRVLREIYAELPRVASGWRLPIEAGFEFDAEPYRVAGILPPRGRGHQLRLGSEIQNMPFIWGLTARILYDFIQHVWIPVHEA